jgi:FlaA1/EpsC-like NDP-sugar epimerase
VNAIRDVSIEDLLGRDEVRLDISSVRGILAGKTGEVALYTIHEELTKSFPDLAIVPLVADVGDSVRMNAIFRTYRPHVVFHAAAHKHVPMMEWNVVEAAKNNVLGTMALAEAAGTSGAEKFILISTDKAVNPTSVMGATKRAAELVIQALDGRYETSFMAVRFGNVLGSTGSVVPKFRKQIAEGGPVTVTHPDMKRYFMTIPEACQLVMQAGALGRGGEIFVLDMGEPVRVVDLARDMVRLSGLEPGADIGIRVALARFVSDAKIVDAVLP